MKPGLMETLQEPLLHFGVFNADPDLGLFLGLVVVSCISRGHELYSSTSDQDVISRLLLIFGFPGRETTQNDALVINSPWHFKSWTSDVHPRFCVSLFCYQVML